MYEPWNCLLKTTPSWSFTSFASRPKREFCEIKSKLRLYAPKNIVAGVLRTTKDSNNSHIKGIIVSLISVEVSSDRTRADPCELYIDILSESPLRDNKDFWNCMIYYGTNYTYATVKYFRVGPRVGLFQIQSPTWCKFDGQDAKGKNYCNINCNKFLDSDLTDDIKCVYEIYKRFGLSYWKSWDDLCKPPPNELIDFCF